MNTNEFIFLALPIAGVIFAIKTRNENTFTLVAIFLFLYFLLVCFFGFDSIVRNVALQAQISGGFSKDFSTALTKFVDETLKVRVLLLVIAGAFLALALFPPKSKNSNDKSGKEKIKSFDTDSSNM